MIFALLQVGFSVKLQNWFSPDVEGSIESTAKLIASRNPKLFWVSEKILKYEQFRKLLALNSPEDNFVKNRNYPLFHTISQHRSLLFTNS